MTKTGIHYKWKSAIHVVSRGPADVPATLLMGYRHRRCRTVRGQFSLPFFSTQRRLISISFPTDTLRSTRGQSSPQRWKSAASVPRRRALSSNARSPLARSVNAIAARWRFLGDSKVKKEDRSKAKQECSREVRYGKFINTFPRCFLQLSSTSANFVVLLLIRIDARA